MKHWLLHIIYIGAMLLLLPACNSGEEDTPSTGDGNMQVVFTLAMDAPQSRALARETWENNESSGNIGEGIDNLIETDGLQVALYKNDGSYIDLVKNLVYYQMETDPKNVYHFVGDISLPKEDIKNTAVKVGVFANCDEVDLTKQEPLSDLQTSLSFTISDAIPESIPMWGVKNVMLTLQPGTQQDLGTIYLLRAMAKVELGLSDDVVKEGYTLESVSFPAGNYNNSGYCMPKVDDWSNWADTKDLDTDGVLNPKDNSGDTSDLDFAVSENKALAYVPEFEAANGAPIMKVTLAKDGTSKTYDVKFATYTEGAAGEFMNVVRNHWYQFNITKVEGEVVVILAYNVADWINKDNINVPTFN